MNTTSLKLSKKLKEAGVEQDSEFYWTPLGDLCVGTDDGSGRKNKLTVRMNWEDRSMVAYDNDIYTSAFLTDELLGKLPETIRTEGWDSDGLRKELAFGIDKYNGMYAVGYGELDDINYHKSIPEAAGEMLLWVIENGYVR